MNEPHVNELPATPEAITAGWLSEALGARAESVEILDRHSGTTGRALLSVVWVEGVPRRPERLFAKLPPTDAAQARMVSSMGMRCTPARG